MHRNIIESDFKNKVSPEIISRKIFLSYPTAIFKDDYDVEFEIKNSISTQFQIPFTSIQIVGSAKTGYSYLNDREFMKKKSDLDVAIINSNLFTEMLNYAYIQTQGYTDYRLFLNKKHELNFLAQLRYGFINPFYLPSGSFRADWMRFFRNLSSKYIYAFKNITAHVYASECLFEMKQSIVIEKYFSGV